ncbi:hypothetical protein ACFFX0_09815 [Citricoccus parietis]|uniref:Uncharacterized protein n=1 Tax=Citricoccus parietis TaxID=592307 RepID=A0ABV5FXR2_9MICC
MTPWRRLPAMRPRSYWPGGNPWNSSMPCSTGGPRTDRSGRTPSAPNTSSC